MKYISNNIKTLILNRSIVAYWVLGLCNNYGYVVMLSAAHDILARHNTSNDHSKTLSEVRHCNELSTGIILLADIVPCLLVKLMVPFLPLWMNIRIFITVLTAALGFILVGLSNSFALAVIGIICTSFSSGIGESSLLSFTVFYKDKSIISAWSSGTGGAGFFGSITYAGLLAIGLSPPVTLFILLTVPLAMAFSFWILLENPLQNKPQETTDTEVSSDAPNNISEQTFFSKINKIPRTLKYILPMFLVYFFVYLINQGLYELSLVDNSFISTSTQYRWYQGLITVYFIFEAIYNVTNNVWVIFGIIFWEGFLGGFTYVNTFYQIQVKEKVEDREVMTGLTSVSDSIGITLSGFVAIPLHNKICTLPKMSLF